MASTCPFRFTLPSTLALAPSLLSAQTRRAPPGVPASVADHTDRVAITWDAIPPASAYRVFRHTVANSAAAIVGNFPLRAGSRDATLLVMLPAVSYSAIVRSAAASTGTALVEVGAVP